MRQPLAHPDFGGLVDRLRSTYDSGRTRPYRWRMEQLARFARMLTEQEDVFVKALASDFRKAKFEAVTTEIAFMQAELKHTRKHLKKWMQPKKVPLPVALQPGRSLIQYEPIGVVLVIAPWNYPLQLSLGPVVGAIAAGNCVVIKPSELAPATAEAIAQWVPKYFDDDAVQVVTGGVPETNALLEQRWDHIFFTGGGRIGQVILEAAAKHLTPVTLELGGKSPCIVDDDLDLEVAARRIAWGKFVNGGQTCVAPDYVLVHEKLEPKLIEKIRENVKAFYGADPKASPDYARIINDRHFARLSKLLQSGEVAVGGETDAAQRYIAPTVLRNVAPESPVMAEEIFGPILPVLKVKSVDEAIAFVNARPKPLALYVFTSRKSVADRVLQRTTSGGAVVNDVLVHLANPDLPFGGVGPSGTGAYHGQTSFETFSHKKAVLKKAWAMDVKIRYPPYSEKTLAWMKRLM